MKKPPPKEWFCCYPYISTCRIFFCLLRDIVHPSNPCQQKQVTNIGACFGNGENAVLQKTFLWIKMQLNWISDNFTCAKDLFTARNAKRLIHTVVEAATACE